MAIHKKNSSRLGPLPFAAFENYALQGRLLGAIVDEELAGYLLYYVTTKNNRAQIVHNCVSADYRRQGISTALVKYLISILNEKRKCIRIHCRRDYNLRPFWSKLNFVVVGEKVGRGKDKAEITIWEYDLELPSLFDSIDSTFEKIQVVIDLNIFFDLEDSAQTNTESIGLNVDWLLDDIELCVTPEVLIEIDRNKDASERKNLNKLVRKNYNLISVDDRSNVDQILEGLKNIIKSSPRAQNESDLRHLAYCISSRKKFYITRDGMLLKYAAQLAEEYHLIAMSPS